MRMWDGGWEDDFEGKNSGLFLKDRQDLGNFGMKDVEK